MKEKWESGFQQVGGLVPRNISIFVYSESHSTSKPCQIQQNFIKEFSYMLFLFVLEFHGETDQIKTSQGCTS